MLPSFPWIGASTTGVPTLLLPPDVRRTASIPNTGNGRRRRRRVPLRPWFAIALLPWIRACSARGNGWEAAVQRCADGLDQLIDRHRAAAVEIEDGALIDARVAERDAHAAQELVDADAAAVVAVTRARHITDRHHDRRQIPVGRAVGGGKGEGIGAAEPRLGQVARGRSV